MIEESVSVEEYGAIALVDGSLWKLEHGDGCDLKRFCGVARITEH